jgi:hypothetical protein
MTALNSGMHFLSGVALYLGAPLSVRSVLQAHTAAKPRRRVSINAHKKTPLSDRQKQELLESIRNDDWHE